MDRSLNPRTPKPPTYLATNLAKARNNVGPSAVNGFINLFKPPGITSMDALRQIKRITGQRQKVGHGNPRKGGLSYVLDMIDEP